MKIILFADKLPPNIGGMETHAHYFVNYFKNKYDLKIISKSNGEDVLVSFDYTKIMSIKLEDYLPLYKDEKTILFFNSGMWIEELTKIKNILPKAIMLYRTGGNEIIKAPLKRIVPLYEDRKNYWRQSINNNIDFLITNSNYTDKRLLDFGIDKNILRHIAGGIDPNMSIKAMSNKNKTKTKYRIKDHTKLVVTASRFVPYKRVDYLLRALNNCENDFQLLIAGGGSLEKELKEQAKNCKIPVRFMGTLSQEETLELISIANVYVQASCDLNVEVQGGSYIHTEGMGRSLLEAICMGVPVVVTNCGAVSEYINNTNGVLVESEEELKNSVDMILSKEKVFNIDIGENMEKYSFNRIFNEYEKLWNKKEY